LQDALAKRRSAPNEVVAGPHSCNYEWEQLDGYLPQGDNMYVGHLIPKQAMMKCINLGCAGFTYQGSATERGRIKVYIKSAGQLDPKSKGLGWVTFLPSGASERGIMDTRMEPDRLETAEGQEGVRGAVRLFAPFSLLVGSRPAACKAAGLVATALAFFAVSRCGRGSSWQQGTPAPGLLAVEASESSLME